MPRKARVILQDTAHHIVQRGHNRNAVFIESTDYHYYLNTLQEWKQKLGIKIYSYCLMTNHVHLILDPCQNEHSIGKMMKRLAGRQTRYVNALERRTGSLWEGRYKSSPIEMDTYLLACCRYVEMNPVRAGMVNRPEEYDWSSYRQKTGTETTWIDIDTCYLALSEVESERRQRYRQFVLRGNVNEIDTRIRNAYQHGWLTGSNRFVDEVEARSGIRVDNRKRGRPSTHDK